MITTRTSPHTANRAKDRPTRRRLLPMLAAGAAVVLALAGPLSAPPAWAQSADALRANGQACERPDGLLKALDPGVSAAVDAINRQRLATYQQIANQQGGTVAQVRVVSGQKLQGKFGGCS